MTRLFPGVQIRELDKSDYIQRQASTVCGLVGVATRGPLHVPTLISDEQDFINTFGYPPSLSNGQNEIQVVSLTNSPSSGNFTLTFNGETSANIGYNATAANVRTALEAMTPIGTGNVSVTGNAGGPWTIQFIGNLANTNVGQLSGNAGTLNNSAAVTVSTLQAGVTPAGDFAAHSAINFLKRGRNLVFVRTCQYTSGGGWLAATAATIAPGNAGAIQFGSTNTNSIQAKALTPGEWGNGIQLRFVKIDGRNTNARYTLTLTSVSSGNFTLTYTPPGGAAQTTGNIAYNAGASAIQTALEGLAEIGAGNVTVTVVGAVYTITFVNVLGQSARALSATLGGLSGGSPAIASLVTGGVAAPAETVYRVDVYAPLDSAGTLGKVETFQRVMVLNNSTFLNQYSAYWLPDAINKGIRNAFPGSTYITIPTPVFGNTGAFPATADDITTEICTTAQAAAGGVSFTFTGGNSATNTAGGTAGDYAAAYVGTQVDPTYGSTALQALANPQTVDVNLIALPGVTSNAALAAMVNLCETRADCFCIIDTPSGLSYSQAIDWHNQAGAWAQLGYKPNSSYAAIFWPWIQGYDAYNKQFVLYPPSVFMPAQFAHNDLVAAPWFAAAGQKRGVLDLALGLESPTPPLGALESLYSGGNVINVIVNFKQTGPTVYGDRTTQRRATKLDRLHTRRGLLFIEKAVASASEVIPFDANDDITRGEFKSLVTPLLESMKNARGVKDFRVICDSSNNTALDEDQSNLNGRILYIPMGAVETVTIDFTLLSSGASFDVS
jgi:hypothetical protein